MAKSVSEYAAEPLKYFSHDSNAASDIKCQKLIMRRGYDGYGRWWRLCEYMASIDGHAVPFSCDEEVFILGQVLGFSTYGDIAPVIVDTTDFVNDLLDLGLVSKDKNGSIFSERMIENSMVFGRKRHAGGTRKKKKEST